MPASSSASRPMRSRPRARARRRPAGSTRTRPMRTASASFIAKILDPAQSSEFLEALQTLARRVALLGALNSLSQLTLKATLPGVPDFYQGTEYLGPVAGRSRQPPPGGLCRAADGAGVTGNAGLARADQDLAERPAQAGLDAAPAQTAQRTRRCVRAGRVSAAAGPGRARRPRHCLCPPTRPHRCDRRGRAPVRAVHARGPRMARVRGR